MSFFANLIWQWNQLRPGFNWRTFHLVMFEVEDDRILGAVEATIVLLGVGFRVRWTYTRTEKMQDILDQVAEIDAALTTGENDD